MGNPEFLHYLLHNGATLDCCDQKKPTLLGCSLAEYKVLENVEILLKNRVKINAENNTPLLTLGETTECGINFICAVCFTLESCSVHV